MRKIYAGVNDGEVGIWWYTPDREVWQRSCLLDVAKEDGNYLQFSTKKNHLTEWQSVVKEYIEDREEASRIIDLGYKAYERGRVVFDLRTQSYEVTCSDSIVNDIQFKRDIITAFHIPRGRVDFVTLNHYYVHEKGNPALDEFEYFM